LDQPRDGKTDDIPLLSMLKERMSWLTKRQEVLSQNVASAECSGLHAARPEADGFRTDAARLDAPVWVGFLAHRDQSAAHRDVEVRIAVTS
jgi:hypothetical protein